MNTTPQKRIRILLVDDHEVVRLGLHTLLNRVPNFEVVAEASSAATALEEVKRCQPDVVLLDVRLGGESGLEVCRQIRQSGAECRVLILTSYANDEFVSEAILAGAEGYLLKEINSENLIKCIEDIASGKSILDPNLTRQVFSRFKSIAEGQGGPSLDQLSPQEMRILARVAEGKTNKEIAVELNLSDKTIKNYLSNLMDKLNCSRRSQAAVFYSQHAIKKEAPFQPPKA